MSDSNRNATSQMWSVTITLHPLYLVLTLLYLVFIGILSLKLFTFLNNFINLLKKYAQIHLPERYLTVYLTP